MRRILLTLLAIVASSPVVSAELTDFSQVRCETPGVQEIILKVLPKMTSERGTQFSQDLDMKAIQKIETVKAERDTLICRMTINVGEGGTTHIVRGRYTVKQFSDGRLLES